MKARMDSKPTREETENAAATWLLKRADPQWSQADESEFEQWLAQAPGNRVSFIRLESIWTDADRIRSIASGFPKGKVPPRGVIEKSPFFTLKQAAPDTEDIFTEAVPLSSREEREGPVTVGRVRIFAIAATVLVTCAAGFLGWDYLQGPHYSTAIGVTTAIPTPDGSIVTLNTNSEVKVKFTDKERHIRLERGEAFFEVAKDPNRPFIVTAGGKRVIAVGTAFSVRLNPDDIRVVVTEGKVRLDRSTVLVRDGRGTEGEGIPLSSREEREGPAQREGEVLLTAGAVADIGKSRVHVEQRSVPEVEQTLSWRTGYIALNGTPLSEAVAEFNRYNTRQLVVDDASLSALKIEGNFRSNNLDGFVRLLEEGFEIKVGEVEGDRIVLGRKEK